MLAVFLVNMETIKAVLNQKIVQRQKNSSLETNAILIAWTLPDTQLSFTLLTLTWLI